MYSWVIPMQSARMTPKSKLDDIFPCGFWAETKLDGWRCQLRKVGGVLQLFSRTGTEYTDTFRSVLNAISKDKLLTVHNCVVDGEILTWHKVRREYGLSTSVPTVAKATRYPTGDSDLQLVIRLWDVMNIDDEKIMGLSLKMRRERLRKIVTNTDVLRVVEPLRIDGERVLHTWADMIRLLKETVDRNEEGLVLKDPNSKYKPGGKQQGDWLKVKPEYFQQGSQEYDLLVVGASGVKGKLTHFLAALAEDPPDGKKPNHFHTFTHVGGMNPEEKSAVNTIIGGHMAPVKFNSKEPLRMQNTREVTFRRMIEAGTQRRYVIVTWAATDSLEAVHVHYSGKKQEACNWVFDPRFSVITTVKADYRVMPTTTFDLEKTLRFPRLHEKGIREHRPDLDIYGDPKPWWGCMCLGEWDSIVKASLDPTAAERTWMCFDKIAATKRAGPPPKVPETQVFRKFFGNGEKDPNGVLANFVIHVQQCEKSLQKVLEEMATRLGARVFASDPQSGKAHKTFPDGTTFIRIGTETTSQRFLNCVDSNQDIVDANWLRDCVNASDKAPELHPKYMLNTSEELLAIFNNKFDILGKRQTRELSVDAAPAPNKFPMRRVNCMHWV
jgi:hypothetical protein